MSPLQINVPEEAAVPPTEGALTEMEATAAAAVPQGEFCTMARYSQVPVVFSTPVGILANPGIADVYPTAAVDLAFPN